MGKWPRISLVTPSFNQEKYIAETVESVMTQGYPYLEHIVIDGGSTDGTLKILKQYPHLKIISEPDHGQAEAINKGFRLATGEIWGFLNSDDSLLPGALYRIAKEIDPKQGRHIVMGRCRFIDEHGHFIGIEHPSYFESHRRVLAIWKGHTIPQPAVFWTAKVWRDCGPMDEGLQFALDYDLFCRFSQKYRFHFIDQILATYRLHSGSKTEQQNETERLEGAARISRRYWGSLLSLMYWQLAFSLAWYRFNRVGRARSLLLQAKEAWGKGDVMRAFACAVVGQILAPEVVFYVTLYPPLKGVSKGILRRILRFRRHTSDISPQTAAYFGHTDPWPDGWVGPHLIISRVAGFDAHAVFIQGWMDLRYVSQPFVLTARVDGQWAGQQHIEKSGNFRLELPLPQAPSPGMHAVEVRASAWFVPHRFKGNKDYRPLSFRIEKIHL